MKKVVILFACLLSACVNPPEPPSGTLSKDKMVKILTEIHLAEAAAQQAGFLEADSTQVYYKYLEKKIFRKYKTDSTHYHDSYSFYTDHPKLLQEIYTIVVDTLAARQTKESQTHDSTTNKPVTPVVDPKKLRLLQKK